LRLHFDGERILFSSIGTHDRWQVFETKLNGTGLRQVSLGEYAKSSAEVRNKLDAAESRLAPFLAAERARNPRQPVSRGSARGKILPVKTGDCKADPGNLSALKDCINDFYR